LEDNTKTELEIGLCGVEWMYLTQDMNQQGFLRTTQQIFWFHNSEEVLEQASDFSRRAPVNLRLSPLGMSATTGPIVQAWSLEYNGMIIGR
jgi:hypothetical protein